MKARLPLMLVLVVTSVLFLGGCYDDVGTTLYEPHQYKGKSDPLLAKLRQDGLQQTLETRFEQVQTDR